MLLELLRLWLLLELLRLWLLLNRGLRHRHRGLPLRLRSGLLLLVLRG